MSGIAQSLLSAFGGSTNLTSILALLGGFTGIAMILMSPVMAFIIQVKWSTQQKNIAVWIASFAVTGLGMAVAHAFTGTLWDVGTWITMWGAMSVGATTLHDKFWGTNGTGLSTFIESNYFPGTTIAVPTNVATLIAFIEKEAPALIEKYGVAGVINIITSVLQKKVAVTPGTIIIPQGAAAQPLPSSAPLDGAPSVIVQADTGVAAVAQGEAIDLHGSTGQSYVPAGTVLPEAAAPTITPAPDVAAQAANDAAAIAAGVPVMEVADVFNPQAD